MGGATDFLQFLVLLFILLFWLSMSKRDDSDTKKERSGLCVYTDHKTGVQYVGTILGGITPRLNADGSIHTVDTKQ